jgi:hypothetical protein
MQTEHDQETQSAATAEAIEQLYRENGGYQVSIDFQGYSALLCGIDDYNYASDEVAAELAQEIAAEMRAGGYIITNEPETQPQKRTRYSRLDVQNWNSPDSQSEQQLKAIMRKRRKNARHAYRISSREARKCETHLHYFKAKEKQCAKERAYC